MRIVPATIWCRFQSWGLVKKLNFCSDLEHKGWSRFGSWSSGKICSWKLASFFCWFFVEVMKLNLGRDSELQSEARFWSISLSLTLVEMFMFGWDFEVDTCSRFWRWNMIKICVRTCSMNSTLGSVVPLAMFLIFKAFQTKKHSVLVLVSRSAIYPE